MAEYATNDSQRPISRTDTKREGRTFKAGARVTVI